MAGAFAALSFVQNAYVVHDLDAACADLHRRFGWGPFLGGDPFELGGHMHRGRPAAPIRLRGVFVQAGELNVELIQLLSDGPSAFRDTFPHGGEGFHHVATFADDYPATRDRLVAEGFPVASEFDTGFGARICYLDSREALGHMIELYPEHPVIRSMYAQTREAAAAWDGRALIAPFAF